MRRPSAGNSADVPHRAGCPRSSATAAARNCFRGTMVRHSCRGLPNRELRLPAASRLRWQCLARPRAHFACPIRFCVQERLPPGAAAVLINRTHTYTDIYLPIDEQEKRLLDAIDGQRTIRAIATKPAWRCSRRRVLSSRRLLAIRRNRFSTPRENRGLVPPASTGLQRRAGGYSDSTGFNFIKVSRSRSPGCSRTGTLGSSICMDWLGILMIRSAPRRSPGSSGGNRSDLRFSANGSAPCRNTFAQNRPTSLCRTTCPRGGKSCSGGGS